MQFEWFVFLLYSVPMYAIETIWNTMRFMFDLQLCRWCIDYTIAILAALHLCLYEME